MRLNAAHLLLISLPRILTAQAATTQPGPATFREVANRFRVAHETSILRDFSDFLAIPNLASDGPDIRRNAARLIEMLRRRGVSARLLEVEGAPPAVLGELRVPGAARTLVLYAHYDGQPVDPSKWATPP